MNLIQLVVCLAYCVGCTQAGTAADGAESTALDREKGSAELSIEIVDGPTMKASSASYETLEPSSDGAPSPHLIVAGSSANAQLALRVPLSRGPLSEGEFSPGDVAPPMLSLVLGATTYDEGDLSVAVTLTHVSSTELAGTFLATSGNDEVIARGSFAGRLRFDCSTLANGLGSEGPGTADDGHVNRVPDPEMKSKYCTEELQRTFP